MQLLWICEVPVHRLVEPDKLELRPNIDLPKTKDRLPKEIMMLLLLIASIALNSGSCVAIAGRWDRVGGRSGADALVPTAGSVKTHGFGVDTIAGLEHIRIIVGGHIPCAL